MVDDFETPLEKAIRICGGQSALADKIGKTQQHVSYWRTAKNGVPPEHARAIEIATGGAVTRHDLRPDIFDSAQSEPAQ